MDPSSELLSPGVCLNIHTRVSNQYTKMNVFQAELFLNSSSSMWELPVFLLLLLSMTSLLLSHSTSNLSGTHIAIEIYLTSYYLHCSISSTHHHLTSEPVLTPHRYSPHASSTPYVLSTASRAVFYLTIFKSGLPCWLRWWKESACNTGDPGSIPGSGNSRGEGNNNPLQYSCLENSMHRGAWQVTVHGVAKNWTWLSD